ncbi:MAG TPA: dTMP kinase [Desulfotomaculum sp.]|nr:MAG: Thymidylate kinase [Desulfotomaculum sp. 46_80]HAG10888.1 dTMP kinase [Desulfotomaculum sp.]HBY04817.1 dTMP kinase [Desulfotomaculum sp.]
MKENKRGLFFVFEGIDGAGKSTQAELLAGALLRSGREVETYRDPGGTPLGENVREMLLDKSACPDLSFAAEALLYAAARAQLAAGRIGPAMAMGRTVISDRFGDSTIAYQGYGRGLDVGLLTRVNDLATGGLTPDLTFLLDLSPELSKKRIAGEADRLEQEETPFFRRVREGYLFLAGQRPGAYHVLDAMLSKEEIHRRVIEAVEVFTGEVLQ